MLRKLKRQIPGEPLAARYNWCHGPAPGRGPAVEKHCPKRHWDRVFSEYFGFTLSVSLSSARYAFFHSLFHIF